MAQPARIGVYFRPNGRKIAIACEGTAPPGRLIPVNIGTGDRFKPEFPAISPENTRSQPGKARAW